MKIIDKILENDTVTSIIVDVADQPLFRNRKPAQFATLQLPRGEGWSESHPFTINNAPGSDEIRFSIKKLGPFTTGIRDIAVGTPVICKGPFGSFCADLDRHTSVAMLAGGIGITPFLGVLRHYQATRVPHPAITLMWGNINTAEMFAVDELSELAKDLGVTVIHRISGELPPQRPGVRIVEGFLDAGFLRANIALDQAALYVCGSPGMKAYVLGELTSCGVDVAKVKSEVIQWKPPAQK